MKNILIALFILGLFNSILSAQVIGPVQDGVYYTVLYTTTIYKPDCAHCGYNQLSIPRQAEYRRETRQYTQYRAGKVVRVWAQDVDIFVRCCR